MSKTMKFDKATAKWFGQNPNAESTVARCKMCDLFYKPELGHKCDKTPKLTFNRKIGNIELRACPPRLAPMYKGEPNDTIDAVMWQEDSHGKPWCFSIAYFKRGEEGYSLYFVGARPFMYVAEERVPELWEALHEAQSVLDGWFDDTEAMNDV